MTEIVTTKLHDESFVLNNVVNGEEFVSDLRGNCEVSP